MANQPAPTKFFNSFIQAKLNIGPSNDIHEQEANRMADHVMRMPTRENSFFRSAPDFVQRNCDCNGEEELQMKAENTAVDNSTAPPTVENVIHSAGESMDSETRNFMEAGFGYNFSDVQVHNDSLAQQSSADINALAYTHGNHVVFGKNQYQPGTYAGKQLLAHELAHVVQQSKMPGSRTIQQQPDPKRIQSPQDKQAVANAKARLAKLEPLLQQAEDRRFSIEADKLNILASRKRLDENAADLAMPSKLAQEESNLANLNRSPLTISQNENEIIFNVKFQVFFEDPSMKKRFEDLKNNVAAGIDIVWKQTLTGDVLGGRKFTIRPSFTLINSRSERDHNSWLINVRATDTQKVAYPGCSLPEPDPGVPTSVTDPMCDGGVMSIPPRHITLPGVLGHEMLHLFGLIDRYFTTTSMQKGKKPVLETEKVRETGGRKDPLGAEDGTILREDLGYLFDRLGVYKTEGEQSDAIIAFVKPQVMKLRRIVELGYDPDSLLPTRENFNDKIIKSAEDL